MPSHTHRGPRSLLVNGCGPDNHVFRMTFLSVGTTGFEPATPCSQSRCATELRHVPCRVFYSLVSGFAPSSGIVRGVLRCPSFREQTRGLVLGVDAG